MFGGELLRYLDKIEFLRDYQIELYPIDSVWCPPIKLPCLYVINTDYGSGIGEHYLSFIIDREKRVTFFDSYGFQPISCFVNWWRKYDFTPVTYSKLWLQSPFSQTCGYFQIVFALFMSGGVSFDEFLSMFDETNLVLNDLLVVECVNKL